MTEFEKYNISIFFRFSLRVYKQLPDTSLLPPQHFNHFFFNFQPSSRPDQLLHAGRLLRPLNQTTKPVHQTDRPPDDYRHDSRPDLRSDHQTQSPNYQSIRSGHHLHARPTKPTRLLSLMTTQHQISTAHPIF